MHHVTDNGPEDLSCTLFYQRDNFFHFVCYFFRFYFLAWFELPMFFVKRGRVKEPMRMMAMEISCYLAMIHLALNVDFMATFMSFILPFNIVRFGMMQGNWVQHSFLERTNPLGGGLQNSITLVHCVYNRDCFNDGYHASHHLHPLRHYLEHPANLIQNRQTYYESKAIVFKETSYDYIWWLLMTKNYEKLASYWVHIGPKEEEPSCAEIVKMLKEKTRIFSREEITPFLKKGK
ncbi:hypothetical protein ROZALSC1DRAFT_28950 [Rozella allomycis CSF55]|uniref:Fatty acid desaturase domain-containing protein n=1 Tax=Rozella allomycis (strain CSF55) TaxID=988480 RepID=A0A075B380_ROZAC|nr:hypothetical protein O9G_000654 [Rozella allomycis CSF55]RKP19457.1 hypothetical protein ROZALSC1DRAFT_28950 [Rozella allomycis CSF55]|eukprot:EPZ35258.1 hypothetical protein O9G_000654 [Rozella allomycis CSF55]